MHLWIHYTTLKQSGLDLSELAVNCLKEAESIHAASVPSQPTEGVMKQTKPYASVSVSPGTGPVSTSASALTAIVTKPTNRPDPPPI